MTDKKPSSSFKYMFGGNREKAIQRDGEKCVKCGMTRAEHRERFGRDITVDHIDNNGSQVPSAMKNNSMDNLQTLCSPCHGKKDSRYARQGFKLTDNQVINIRHIGWTIEYQETAKLYGVSPSYISLIMNNKARVS